VIDFRRFETFRAAECEHEDGCSTNPSVTVSHVNVFRATRRFPKCIVFVIIIIRCCCYYYYYNYYSSCSVLVSAMAWAEFENKCRTSLQLLPRYGRFEDLALMHTSRTLCTGRKRNSKQCHFGICRRSRVEQSQSEMIIIINIDGRKTHCDITWNFTVCVNVLCCSRKMYVWILYFSSAVVCLIKYKAI